MVNLPISDENLRNELQIPTDAIVLGYYGSKNSLNMDIAQHSIIKYLELEPNVYFLFMNINNFYTHPRIIYLERNLDLNYKVKFINSCDAMIHGRKEGESFGLSVAEFSSKNKPVITCSYSSNELTHIKILGEKAIIYSSFDELMYIFTHIKKIINSRTDWNAYKLYSPEHVMQLFKELIFDK
jgi:glycosyltransferase involved in cell wall biosynthesis